MARSTARGSGERRPYRRLSRSFFTRPTDRVAEGLLGKLVVHGGRAGVIVECEAYLGPEDLASHTRFGETDRNRVMFERGGVAYVYLCYGVHFMLNIVGHRRGQAGAVLLRAIAPYAGLGDDPAVARGPGKLTRALAITRRHNGIDLVTDRRLFLAHGPRPIAPAQRAVGSRIGIDYAGEWVAAPLRFWIADHPAVSRTRSLPATN